MIAVVPLLARPIDAVLKALRECQRKLRQLKAGDELTEHAEGAFSELADAVETVLKERRMGTDRRSTDRKTADRRKTQHDVE
jgi:hypothetical protein